MKTIFVLLLVILTPLVFAQVIYAPPGKYFLKIEFSQPMDTTTTRVIDNYTIFDQDMEEFPVLNVATASDPETGVCYDSLIVLLINAPEYKTHYVIRVQDVYGTNQVLVSDSANSLWFYFDGYDPNQLKPYLIIKE